MRCPASAILVVVLSSPGLGWAAGAENVSPYDVLSYRLAIDIDFEQSPSVDSPYRSLYSVLNTLSAEATIRLRNISDRPQDEISLILHRLMSASEIEAGGKPLSFDQQLRGLEGWEAFQVRHLTARWSEPLPPGGEATLSVSYGGQLVGYPEVGMLYVRETLDPDFTILRSETFCYPQVSRPERNAVDSAGRLDTFDQALEVTVPAGHVAVSGGRSTGVSHADGKTTYSFSSYEPDRAIVVAVAPYEVRTSGRHRIFHFKGSAEGVGTLAGNLERVMALFTSWFGPPGLDRGLTIAEIPPLFGSQAGALILQTSGAFTDSRQYAELYHELSHLWNPEDVDLQPSRWNEGLAMFLQGLAEEKLEGRDDLNRLLSETFSDLKERLEENARLTTVAMVDYGREDMTSYSYSTGALLFGLLHDRVGERALLEFIGSYSREHREAGSTDRAFAEQLVSSLGEGAREIVREWFLTPAFAHRLRAADSWDELKDAYPRPFAGAGG